MTHLARFKTKYIFKVIKLFIAFIHHPLESIQHSLLILKFILLGSFLFSDSDILLLIKKKSRKKIFFIIILKKNCLQHNY